MTNIVDFPRPKMPFNLGDIVTLRSGGPPCIVTEPGTQFTVYSNFGNDLEPFHTSSPNECLQLLLAAPICDEDGYWSNCVRT